MVYTQWKYRVKIGVNNPVNIADYQINVIIPYRVHMNSNFSDIRFSDVNGNELSYWIESYTSLVSANVYIKCPNNCYEFYLYYGNPSATTASNGNTTFMFFDDFTGTVIDTNKWVEVDASGYITQNDQLLIGAGNGWGVTGISTVKTFERPIVVEMKINSTNLANDFMFGIKDSGTTLSYVDYIHGLHFYNSGNMELYEDGTSRGFLTTYAINTYYWIKIELFSTGAKMYRSLDNITWTLLYTSAYSTEVPVKVGFSPNVVGSTIIDNNFVRNYASPEPTATIYQTNINPFHRRFNPLLIYTYTKLYSIDTLIKALNINKNYNLDTLIKKLNIDKNYTIDLLISNLGIDKNYIIDILIKKLNIDKNYNLDTLIKLLDIDKTYSVDTLIKLLDIDKNYVIDLILKAIINETYSVDTLIKLLDIDKIYSVDTLIKLLDIDKIYSVDTLIKSLNINKTYSVDTLIKLLDINTNYVIDILFKKLNINKTYSNDALIKLLDINTNYVVDGIFVQIVTFKPTASGRQIKPTASGRQIKPTASGRQIKPTASGREQ